jgi:PAS domain S-box-containing protein
MGSLRILIVDDHEVVRKGIRALLSSRTDCVVCGEAEDGVEAVEKAKHLRPDIVLMDTSMPRMDRVEATRIIRREVPESEVIVVSQNDPTVVSRQAAEIDASEYIAETDMSRDLLPAVDRAVARRKRRRLEERTEDQSKFDIIDADQNKAELARQAKLLDLSFNAVILRDGKDRITYWNKGAEELYGWERDEVLGQVTHSLFQTEFSEPLDSIFEQLRREKRWQGELTQTRKNGARLTVLSRWALQCDSETNIESIMEANIDISAAKEASRLNNLLAAIVGSSDDAIISKSLDGTITSWNSGAERMFGYSAKEAVGKHITLIVPQDRRGEETNILKGLKRGERIDHFETVRVRKDGTQLDISLTISPVKDGAGNVIGASKVARDVTARKRIERALRENEERYRTLFDLAPVAVYSCDVSGVIQAYNSSAAELWGRKPELGDTDERFCGSFKLYRPDGSFMPHDQCPMGDVLTGKVPATHDAEVHIERPDGSRVIVIVNIAPLKDDRGEITGAINCFYDVTERKMAEEALRRSIADRLQAEKALRENENRLRLANEELESVVQNRTASLRHLSAKLMRSQDEERRRIARNLHDSLGQYLTSIKMNLELLRSSDAPNKDEVLSATLESVERSLAETRTLSCLLHPPLLDEVGFTSAARWYTDEFAKRSGIKMELELPEGVDRLPELVRIALFRILQESLTNVHRHSGSPSVEVRLKVNNHQAVLTVRDFGRGVPAELIQGSQANGEHFGVGLSGMRERVNDLGGTFEIQSSGNGTLIIVSIPLATETSDAGVPGRIFLHRPQRALVNR